MRNQVRNYWDERAKASFKYKGETFYTITAIPYYYLRRKLIIKKIQQIIKETNIRNVCDFGCGDGEYVRLLAKNLERASFFGLDISEAMIEIALQKNAIESLKNVIFEVSETGITQNKESFDLVYVVAVFAHMQDELVCKYLKNIKDNCVGKIVLVEQIAPKRYEGKGYIRRSLTEYENLLNSVGFRVVNKNRIDFWMHRLLFERKIGRRFINNYQKKNGVSKNMAMIMLNNKFYYRFLSWIFSKLSIAKVFNNDGWGYCFLVGEKDNGECL